MRQTATRLAKSAAKRTTLQASAAAAPKSLSSSTAFIAVASASLTTLAASTSRPTLKHTLNVASTLPSRITVGRRFFSVDVTKVPSLGDSVTEGTIVTWEKNVGDYVNADDVLLVIETDKVSIDIRSPKAGVLKKQLVNAGDTVQVGQEVAEVDTAAAKPAAAAPAPKKEEAAAPKTEAKPTPTTQAQAAPAAAPAKPAAEKKAAAPASQSAAPVPGSRTERRVPMTRMRQTIANRLKASQNTAAMLTTFNEIDMSNIMELRNRYKDEFLERHGVKLGFMSAFVKASTYALMKNPEVNAYIQDGHIVYHDFVDVSVAVSTGTGLVVPVLRNTETLSFAQVESGIAALGVKARKGQIAMEDMVGGTFTISNGGVFGSLFGTPILNPPQSAILGMHGIFKRPVAVGDKVEVRPMMYVALTYDHRIIDGSNAVTFLKDIKQYVEDPQRMLLDL